MQRTKHPCVRANARKRACMSVSMGAEVCVRVCVRGRMGACVSVCMPANMHFRLCRNYMTFRIKTVEKLLQTIITIKNKMNASN